MCPSFADNKSLKCDTKQYIFYTIMAPQILVAYYQGQIDQKEIGQIEKKLL